MKSSSRTLTALASGGLLLALAAWLFVRSTPERLEPPAAVPGAPASKEALSKPPETAAAPRERVEHAESAPQTIPPKRLRGLVLDEETDKPIERFVIIHSAVGEGHAYVDTILGFEDPEPSPSTAFATPDGRFDLAPLDGKPQSLCAFAEGYARSDPVVAASEDVVIRLHRAAIVRGRVVDPATGVPVQNALVGWIDRSGKTRTGPLERFERTDQLGRFVLGSVPLSARRILAGREDLGEGLSENLELEAGERAQELVLNLPRSGG
ncbi:MAG TPA: hypothetical protein VGR31_03465 [Planctomycetota bacterium]|jgi:hypothetical protein|nr:hypothetical protein [Planctomycetota bacterium]